VADENSISVEWRAIPDHPGYEASTDGQVKSPHGGGRVLRGYMCHQRGRPVCKVVTFMYNGKSIPEAICRLILKTFIGPCPDGMEACHWDGNPANNRLDNLRWDTRKANQADSIRHGTKCSPPMRFGETHQKAKLTDEKVRFIRGIKEWPFGMQQEIARLFGVHRDTISRVRIGRFWRVAGRGDRRHRRLDRPSRRAARDRRHRHLGRHPAMVRQRPLRGSRPGPSRSREGAVI